MPERNLMIAVSFWRAIIRLASYIDTAVAILKARFTDTGGPYRHQSTLSDTIDPVCQKIPKIQ